MINLLQKDSNIFNFRDALYADITYKIRENGQTIDDLVTFNNIKNLYVLNENTTTLRDYYDSFIGGSIDDLTTYQIGYEYGAGILPPHLNQNNEKIIEIETDLVVTSGFELSLTYKTYTYEFEINEVLYEDGSTKIVLLDSLNGIRSLPSFKIFELMSSDTIDVVYNGPLYEYIVTLNTGALDTIEYYDTIRTYGNVGAGNKYKFGSKEKIYFDTEKYFKDASNNLYQFTYDFSVSDYEILSMAGHYTFTNLDLYIPYLDNTNDDWMYITAQILQRYKFLEGYYESLLTKIDHALYRHQNELSGYDYFNYENAKNQLSKDDYEEWYNVVIDLYLRVNVKYNQAKNNYDSISSMVLSAFNRSDETDIKLTYLLNSDQSYTEIHNLEDYKSTVEGFDLASNPVFIYQYLNTAKNFKYRTLSETNTYNSTTVLPDYDVLQILEVYHLDSDISIYEDIITSVDVNDLELQKQYAISEYVKKLFREILSIDVSTYATKTDFVDFINANIVSTNNVVLNSIISVFDQIDEWEPLNTYSINDIVEFNGKIFSSRINYNYDNLPSSKASSNKFWYYIFEDIFMVSRKIYEENLNQYTKFKLEYDFNSQIDRLNLASKLDTQTIVDFYSENNIFNEYMITSYVSPNWYYGSPFTSQTFISGVQSQPNLQDDINLFMLFYMRLIDLEETNVISKSVIDAYDEQDGHDISASISRFIDSNESSLKDTIKIVSGDNLNSIINQLTELKEV